MPKHTWRHIWRDKDGDNLEGRPQCVTALRATTIILVWAAMHSQPVQSGHANIWHPCDKCNTSSDRKRNLQRHRRIGMWGTMFKELIILSLHVYSWYVCHSCDFEFEMRNIFKWHKRWILFQHSSKQKVSPQLGVGLMACHETALHW